MRERMGDEKWTPSSVVLYSLALRVPWIWKEHSELM